MDARGAARKRLAVLPRDVVDQLRCRLLVPELAIDSRLSGNCPACHYRMWKAADLECWFIETTVVYQRWR